MYSTKLEGDPSKVIVLTLANLLTDSFSLSMMMGLNWALQTLVSQAHGANEIGLCGAVYKRAWAINTVL